MPEPEQSQAKKSFLSSRACKQRIIPLLLTYPSHLTQSLLPLSNLSTMCNNYWRSCLSSVSPWSSRTPKTFLLVRADGATISIRTNRTWASWREQAVPFHQGSRRWSRRCGACPPRRGDRSRPRSSSCTTSAAGRSSGFIDTVRQSGIM